MSNDSLAGSIVRVFTTAALQSTLNFELHSSLTNGIPTENTRSVRKYVSEVAYHKARDLFLGFFVSNDLNCRC